MSALKGQTKPSSLEISSSLEQCEGLASLNFVLQHYLPVPDDSTKCPHRRIQERSLETIHSINERKDGWYTVVLCGSSAEGLSLPYQQYDNAHVVVAPTILDMPDIDILHVHKHCLVITCSLQEASIPKASDYVQIFRMRQFPKTHQGYVVLEIVQNLNKPGNPCSFCKDVECGKKAASLCEFLKMTLHEGQQIHCVPSNVRITDTEGAPQGPAFKSICHINKTWGAAETDLVEAIHCPDWPPTPKAWLTRTRPGKWPSAALIEELKKQGCHLVPTGYKGSILEDFEWRVSFSQAEVSLARTLTDPQRKAYLIVKTFLKTSLNEPKVLSSYHLKTLMFWRCETIPSEQWTDSNLAVHVLGLLGSLYDCVSTKCLPHYFIPEHNLIDHFTDSDIEIIAAKVKDVQKNLKVHLQKSFVALMPCCVKGQQMICAKEIYASVFAWTEDEDLPKTTKVKFLQQLAQYYLVLKRYDLFAEKMIHSLNMLETGTCKDVNDAFPSQLLLHEALAVSPDAYTAHDYIHWSRNHFHGQISLTEVLDETAKLRFSLIPKGRDTKHLFFEQFRNWLLENEKQQQQNPRSLAYLAYILIQMDITDMALEKSNLGQKLLDADKTAILESYVVSAKTKVKDSAASTDIVCPNDKPCLVHTSTNSSEAEGKTGSELEFQQTDPQHETDQHTKLVFYKIQLKSMDSILRKVLTHPLDNGPVYLPTKFLLLYSQVLANKNLKQWSSVETTKPLLLVCEEKNTLPSEKEIIQAVIKELL